MDVLKTSHTSFQQSLVLIGTIVSEDQNIKCKPKWRTDNLNDNRKVMAIAHMIFCVCWTEMLWKRLDQNINCTLEWRTVKQNDKRKVMAIAYMAFWVHLTKILWKRLDQNIKCKHEWQTDKCTFWVFWTKMLVYHTLFTSLIHSNKN